MAAPAGKGKQPTIGKLVDDAMVAIERENPTLKGVLPKDFARPALDKQRLGEIIDLIGTIGLGDKDTRSRHVPGRVESSGHGTGRLPSDILLSYQLIMPYARTQEALARPFSDNNQQIALLRAESQTLTRSRDALLPRILSGELSIKRSGQVVEAMA